MPEGTLFFPHEPVLEVSGPVLQAQLVETLVLNEVHFQSLVAAKAARCVDVAGGRTQASRGPGLSSRLVTRSHARRQAGPDRRPYGRADRRPAAPG